MLKRHGIQIDYGYETPLEALSHETGYDWRHEFTPKEAFIELAAEVQRLESVVSDLKESSD